MTARLPRHGSHDTDVSGPQSHAYGSAGTYTVTVLGDGLESISMYDEGDIPNVFQLESIEQWGGTKWITMENAFSSTISMVYRATDAPDLSGVTSMGFMFGNAIAFNGNLSSWNVSSVTDMGGMFLAAPPPSTATSPAGTSRE